MSLKENLKEKIKIDRLVKKIGATVPGIPGQRKVNKEAMRQLLAKTDMELVKTRDLELYVRPLRGETKEVLVLDNELPIYHTTVTDVAMRKTPYWKEMLSIGNVRRILNDQDVVVSKGGTTLDRVRALALDRLDFSYTKEDIGILITDARSALLRKSFREVEESFDLFFELVDFEPLALEAEMPNIRVFARPVAEDERGRLYEDLILFDEREIWVGLMKGNFSPRSDLDLARFLKCAQGEKPADLQGKEVFEFLGELALEKRRTEQTPN